MDCEEEEEEEEETLVSSPAVCSTFETFEAAMLTRDYAFVALNPALFSRCVRQAQASSLDAPGQFAVGPLGQLRFFSLPSRFVEKYLEARWAAAAAASSSSRRTVLHLLEPATRPRIAVPTDDARICIAVCLTAAGRWQEMFPEGRSPPPPPSTALVHCASSRVARRMVEAVDGEATAVVFRYSLIAVERDPLDFAVRVRCLLRGECPWPSTDGHDQEKKQQQQKQQQQQQRPRSLVQSPFCNWMPLSCPAATSHPKPLKKKEALFLLAVHERLSVEKKKKRRRRRSSTAAFTVLVKEGGETRRVVKEVAGRSVAEIAETAIARLGREEEKEESESESERRREAATAAATASFFLLGSFDGDSNTVILERFRGRSRLLKRLVRRLRATGKGGRCWDVRGRNVHLTDEPMLSLLEASSSSSMAVTTDAGVPIPHPPRHRPAQSVSADHDRFWNDLFFSPREGGVLRERFTEFVIRFVDAHSSSSLSSKEEKEESRLCVDPAVFFPPSALSRTGHWLARHHRRISKIALRISEDVDNYDDVAIAPFRLCLREEDEEEKEEEEDRSIAASGVETLGDFLPYYLSLVRYLARTRTVVGDAIFARAERDGSLAPFILDATFSRGRRLALFFEPDEEEDDTAAATTTAAACLWTSDWHRRSKEVFGQK